MEIKKARRVVQGCGKQHPLMQHLYCTKSLYHRDAHQVTVAGQVYIWANPLCQALTCTETMAVIECIKPQNHEGAHVGKSDHRTGFIHTWK